MLYLLISPCTDRDTHGQRVGNMIQRNLVRRHTQIEVPSPQSGHRPLTQVQEPGKTQTSRLATQSACPVHGLGRHRLRLHSAPVKHSDSVEHWSMLVRTMQTLSALQIHRPWVQRLFVVDKRQSFASTKLSGLSTGAVVIVLVAAEVVALLIVSLIVGVIERSTTLASYGFNRDDTS